MSERIPFEIRVTCYAGYRAEEEPRTLHFDDRSVEVTEILDRWLGPDHRYFKVRGADRGTYIIRHDERTQHWEVTLFEREPVPPMLLNQAVKFPPPSGEG